MHAPVLLKEVLEIFSPKSGQTYIDCTANGGGHLAAIHERIGARGKILGIDRDPDLISNLKNKFEAEKNVVLTCDNYANLESIVAQHHFGPVDGILFDLGFSSYHVETAQRGFSFLKDEPLDMRYGHDTHDLTAAHIINTWEEKAIEDILRRFGEERFARQIARGIANARRTRKITTTNELVRIITDVTPRWYGTGHLHPATRTFQALRIAVNHELENLESGISQAVKILGPSGKLAVISFHSLEDRMVKQFFKKAEQQKVVRIVTPKPITASRDEIRQNPRARSAKLRVAERI